MLRIHNSIPVKPKEEDKEVEVVILINTEEPSIQKALNLKRNSQRKHHITIIRT